MRSRALFFGAASLLAAVLIGCGGGGGGGNNNNPTTTSGVPGATQPGDSVAMVNIPTSPRPTGRLNIAYLPLQGRAIEEFVVVIPNIELGLGSDTFIDPLGAAFDFVLNGNQVQQRSVSVPITDNLSRPFNTFYLNLQELIYFADPSSPGLQFGDANNPFLLEDPFPAQVRVFPSRETTVPIFLNDSMVAVDPISNIATFDPNAFTARNGTPIQGYISDFLRFDISQMAGDRPLMSNGNPANNVYFSGDRFAMSDIGQSGYFEMLTDDPANPDKGVYTDPVTIGSSNTPGIYKTIVPDPTDPFGTNTITKIYGIFRNAADAISPNKSAIINTGTFEVILMPKTPDDDDQQILLVALNGTHATNLYFGDAHLASGTFVAYPVANLVGGSTSGQIQGTLSGFLDVSAAPVTIGVPSDSRRVRYGRYNISSLLPAGFRRSGRFIVFRV